MRPLAAMALFVTVLAACSSEAAELAGYTRTPAPESGRLSLPDASAAGTDFHLKAEPGGLLLVYFGFTSCPDVCPTTLADIRTALGDLGDDANRIGLAMVTVDPARDSDEILTGYVQSFVPGAHALRTEDDAALADVAFVLGAAYDVSIADDGSVEVVHTAHVYVIDDAGYLALTWPFGTEPSDMASDLEILLAG
jgi:protein SCO1/2